MRNFGYRRFSNSVIRGRDGEAKRRLKLSGVATTKQSSDRSVRRSLTLSSGQSDLLPHSDRAEKRDEESLPVISCG